jgi:hypothetical protein
MPLRTTPQGEPWASWRAKVDRCDNVDIHLYVAGGPVQRAQQAQQAQRKQQQQQHQQQQSKQQEERGGG